MIEIGLKYTSELTVTDAVTAIAVGSGDDGQIYHHTHALFSFKGGTRDVDNIVGGHLDGQHGMAGILYSVSVWYIIVLILF